MSSVRRSASPNFLSDLDSDQFLLFAANRTKKREVRYAQCALKRAYNPSLQEEQQTSIQGALEPLSACFPFSSLSNSSLQLFL